jgi:MOSC domain-containing protein YiiM
VSGRIFQLSRSSGGVPKLAVREVLIDQLGLEGDKQKHTKFHGGPDRAVCLYAVELIQALQTEGHPIYPGSTGENVTVSGLPWSTIDAGTKIELGPEGGSTVLLEVTRHTEPCKQITASFADGVFRRIDQRVHPGWSRVYARVLREGVVRVGQPVRLIA